MSEEIRSEFEVLAKAKFKDHGTGDPLMRSQDADRDYRYGLVEKEWLEFKSQRDAEQSK